MIEPISADEKARFDEDGFLVREKFLSDEDVAAARQAIDELFAGRYETGLMPDEVNWKPGRDRDDLTRQICNGWKANRTLARILLATPVGHACAELAGWDGARINQDNVFFKPPGGRALGFHQDSSYERWVVPSDMVSCWIALDATSAAGGTVEYVRGSHAWGLRPMVEQFHAPDDPLADMRAAAQSAGVSEPDIVAIEVPAGGAAFHHGGLWHGSRKNDSDRPRRSIVAHCSAADARFHETETGAVYSRYKRFGDTTMDESFFPIIWRRDGYRSGFLDNYCAGAIGWGGRTD